MGCLGVPTSPWLRESHRAAPPGQWQRRRSQNPSRERGAISPCQVAERFPLASASLVKYSQFHILNFFVIRRPASCFQMRCLASFPTLPLTLPSLAKKLGHHVSLSSTKICWKMPILFFFLFPNRGDKLTLYFRKKPHFPAVSLVLFLRTEVAKLGFFAYISLYPPKFRNCLNPKDSSWGKDKTLVSNSCSQESEPSKPPCTPRLHPLVPVPSLCSSAARPEPWPTGTELMREKP